jgi:hypothetical protein
MASPLSDAEHAAIKARIEGQDEIIVAAAIKVPWGGGADEYIILTAERPGRHGNLIYAAGLLSGDGRRGGEHGFLTNHGRFVNRRDAGDIVHIAEQGSVRQGLNGHLFSEDLWNRLGPRAYRADQAGGRVLRTRSPIGASPRQPVDTAAWQPIETAPRDGQHILVGVFGPGAGAGFGWAGPRDPSTGLRAKQAWQDVVHWFDDPEDPGFYSSCFGGDQQRPFDALTHWRPILEEPAIADTSDGKEIPGSPEQNPPPTKPKVKP